MDEIGLYIGLILYYLSILHILFLHFTILLFLTLAYIALHNLHEHHQHFNFKFIFNFNNNLSSTRIIIIIIDVGIFTIFTVFFNRIWSLYWIIFVVIEGVWRQGFFVSFCYVIWTNLILNYASIPQFPMRDRNKNTIIIIISLNSPLYNNKFIYRVDIMTDILLQICDIYRETLCWKWYQLGIILLGLG